MLAGQVPSSIARTKKIPVKLIFNSWAKVLDMSCWKINKLSCPKPIFRLKSSANKMHARPWAMFFRAKKSGSKKHPHEYLQIVESYKDGSTVHQRVIATLGRLDQLKASGQIDALIKSLSRFSETIRVISASKDPKVTTCKARVWRPALVFRRLWEQQGLPEIIGKLAWEHKFVFDVEQGVFALELQRLYESGSDLQGSRWLKTVEYRGFEGLEVQHLYRAQGSCMMCITIWKGSCSFVTLTCSIRNWT